MVRYLTFRCQVTIAFPLTIVSEKCEIIKRNNSSVRMKNRSYIEAKYSKVNLNVAKHIKPHLLHVYLHQKYISTLSNKLII